MKNNSASKFLIIFLFIMGTLVISEFLRHKQVRSIISALPLSQSVIIKTDKTIYKRGETIKITLKNNTFKEITTSTGYKVEKQEEELWKEVRMIECGCGFVCMRAISRIKPRGKKEFQWNQEESWCKSKPTETIRDTSRIKDRFQEVRNQVSSGTYRVYSLFNYKNSAADKTKIYSNTFFIE